MTLFMYILFLAGYDIIPLVVLHAHVDEPYLIAVGTVGVANLQRVGIRLGLPHALRHILLVALGLDHRQFDTLVFKDIVGLLRVLVTSRRDTTTILFSRV